MIGLDTNVIVRYLIEDDAEQSAKVKKYLDSHLTAQTPGFVSLIVLAEVVWVLQASFNMTRQELAAFVTELLETAQLRFERRDHVIRCTAMFRQVNCDLADLLIVMMNNEAGCTKTVTFDRKMARLPGVELLA